MEKLLAFSVIPSSLTNVREQIKALHAIDSRRLTMAESRYLLSRRTEFDLHVRFDGGFSVNPRDTSFFTRRYADLMQVRRQDYAKFLSKMGLQVTCEPFEVRETKVAGLKDVILPTQIALPLDEPVAAVEPATQAGFPKSVAEIMIVNLNTSILSKNFGLARELLGALEAISVQKA